MYFAQISCTNDLEKSIRKKHISWAGKAQTPARSWANRKSGRCTAGQYLFPSPGMIVRQPAKCRRSPHTLAAIPVNHRCSERDSNPHALWAQHFECCVSTNSTIGANTALLVYRVAQSATNRRHLQCTMPIVLLATGWLLGECRELFIAPATCVPILRQF